MEKYMWRCGKQKASLMEMKFFLHIQFDYICCIVLFTPQYSSRRFAIFKSFESYVFLCFHESRAIPFESIADPSLNLQLLECQQEV